MNFANATHLTDFEWFLRNKISIKYLNAANFKINIASKQS